MKRMFFFVLMLTTPLPLLAARVPAVQRFAPIGVANSQTARLNVFMAGASQADGSCAGVLQLRFYDQNGRVVAQRTTRLSPNDTDWLEFAPARETGRTTVRADLSWITWPPGPCRADLISNVELYNSATGETQLAVHGIIIVNSSEQ